MRRKGVVIKACWCTWILEWTVYQFYHFFCCILRMCTNNTFHYNETLSCRILVYLEYYQVSICNVLLSPSSILFVVNIWCESMILFCTLYCIRFYLISIASSFLAVLISFKHNNIHSNKPMKVLNKLLLVGIHWNYGLFESTYLSLTTDINTCDTIWENL
jgi:hypothetical protein